jgi:hypothetical protein
MTSRAPKARKQAPMSDFNRGIMKFDGADSPPAIVLSALIVLGGIAVLIFWALQAAYSFS